MELPSPTPRLMLSFEAPSAADTIRIDEYISHSERLLEDFGSRIASLQAVIDEISRRHQVVRQSIRDHKAIISPVRRLPYEIWTDIFWLCCPGREERSFQATQAPTLLTRVCRSWRNLVLATPTLWSQISLRSSGSLNQPLVRAWISRSLSSSLTLSMKLEYPYSFQEAQRLSRILQLMVKECSRWKDVSFRLAPSMLAEIQPIKGNLPSLESLYIGCNDFSAGPPSIDYFEDAPNLRRFHIDSFISWSAIKLPLHQLTHLNAGFVSVTICLNTLQSCPNLVELQILCDSWLQGREAISHPIPVISLPHLQKLQIEVYGNPNALFDRLDLPSMRHVSMTDNPSVQWLSQEPFISMLNRSSRSLKAMDIRLHSGIDDDDDDESSHYYGAIPDITECLRSVPSLAILCLRGDILQGLFTQQLAMGLTVDPEGKESSLLPMLEVLELEGQSFDLSQLAPVIRSRCGRLPDQDTQRRLRHLMVRLRCPTLPVAEREVWSTTLRQYEEHGMRVSVVQDFAGQASVIL